MKLLLEGSLSETLTLKDLLAGILQAEAPGVSVLQMFLNSEPYGEVFFLGGHFVVGSRLSTSEMTAQESLNQILRLQEANFFYYACESLEALPADKPLKIDLKELVNNWQTVRTLSSDELLDKIFNDPDPTQERQPVAPIVEYSAKEPAHTQLNQVDISEAVKKQLGAAPTLSPFGDKQTDVDWELVNPLLAGGGPGDKAISIIGNEWDNNQHSTHDLRNLSGGIQWQRKLRDLILILVMLMIALIVILCFAWLLMNSPASDISPRRYPSPFFHHGTKRQNSAAHPAQR